MLSQELESCLQSRKLCRLQLDGEAHAEQAVTARCCTGIQVCAEFVGSSRDFQGL